MLSTRSIQSDVLGLVDPNGGRSDAEIDQLGLCDWHRRSALPDASVTEDPDRAPGQPGEEDLPARLAGASSSY